MYMVATAYVFGVWVWGADNVHTSINGDPRSTLSSLLLGTADKPFVQRALVPAITRIVVNAIPLSTREALSSSLCSSPKFIKEAARLGWELQYVPEYMVALLLAFASLVCFPFVVRRMLRCLYDTDPLIQGIVPVMLVLGLPFFFHAGTHYIYDFPALLFFTVCLLLLLEERWFIFYPVYAIGCVNKETMVLLVFATVLLGFRKAKKKVLVLHLPLQGGIFVAIKSTLAWIYRDNPGGSLEFHLWGNIHNILLPYSLPDVALFALVCFLIFCDFSKKPFFLRRMAWLMFPFGVLVLVFGTMNEVRALYEVYPVFGLLMAHTVFFSVFKTSFTLVRR